MQSEHRECGQIQTTDLFLQKSLRSAGHGRPLRHQSGVIDDRQFDITRRVREQSATRRRIASSIAINATPSIVIVVVIAIVIIIVIVIVIVVEVIMTAMVSMKGNVVGNVIEDALHCALDVVGLMLNPFHTLRVGVLPFLHFLIQKALGERVSVAAGCSLVMGIAAAVYIAVPIDDVFIS